MGIMPQAELDGQDDRPVALMLVVLSVLSHVKQPELSFINMSNCVGHLYISC